jgi:AmiR/NasT family two-component response regulator
VNERRSIRVLIAEDSYLISEVIKTILGEIGYTVVGEATDGYEAVEMTQSLRPDVVLMDIQMPNMDGLEATRWIHERCPTPVVALTAHETQELVQQASEAGVSAYLVKPPNIQEVERAIIVAMARFDDMMELRRVNAELQEALVQVKTLSGLLPICMSCKKIRDDEGYWHRVEAYITAHSDAEFSHGLCPDCAKELYPSYFGDDE